MREIKLTQGKVALVDDSDFDFLNQWKWYAMKTGRKFYAARRINRFTVLMHRLLLNLTNTKILTDHIDRNGLNNQRDNLREATIRQNAANRDSFDNSSSKYLGVYWDPARKKWMATIKDSRINKTKGLGGYKNEIDAAKAYNNAAKIIHGAFANLNKV